MHEPLEVCLCLCCISRSWSLGEAALSHSLISLFMESEIVSSQKGPLRLLEFNSLLLAGLHKLNHMAESIVQMLLELRQAVSTSLERLVPLMDQTQP